MRTRREAVLQELKDLALASILDYIEFDPSGVRLRPGLSQADTERAAFSGIKISKTKGRQAISLKMGGKLVALDMLAKVLGMYETSVTRQTRPRR